MIAKSLCLLFSFFSFIHCNSKEIPLTTKLECALKMNEGFFWQAAGHSTVAFAAFDQGYERALKEGESAKKLEPIRQMFFWYRTYGHYLGIMAPAANGYDKIHGEYEKRSHSSHSSLSNYPLRSPDLEARRREYLLGVTEIISGLMGIWLIPSPTAKRASFSVAFDGGRRIWKIYQDFTIEQNIALLELKRITDSVEKAAKD